MSLQTLIDEFAAVKKDFQAKAQDAMKQAFKEIFELYPNVTAFRWTQYTPYFNDGEPCEFRVGDIGVTNIPVANEMFDDITPYGDYEGDANDEIYAYSKDDPNKPFFCSSYNFANHHSFRNNDPSKLNEFLKLLQNSEMENILQDTFGDHVYVTATRDGFDIEEYDHE